MGDIELDVYDQEVPFLGGMSAFEIKRQGFWTYEYQKSYPHELSSRISSDHYDAMLETITRIHSRYQYVPVLVQSVAIFVVFAVLEITLATALFTPVVLITGLLLTLGIPLSYGIFQFTGKWDHQTASVRAFLYDANIEFKKIGLQWVYTSPRASVILRAEEIDAETELQGLQSFTPPPDIITDCHDHPWSSVESKIKCTCIFIEFNELMDSDALVSTNIPYSSRDITLIRISLFPSGRLRVTMMVALEDVKSAWLNVNDIKILAMKKDSIFSLWEPTHLFNADHLLDLINTHLED